MNYERLLNVARACRETNFPHAFTMVRFVTDCGSPGCALGNYAARADLQSAFQLRPDATDNLALCHSGFSPVGSNDSVGYDCPRVLEHFDISEDEAEELFGSEGCGGAKTPAEAAAFIEKFVRARQLYDE